MISLSVHGGVEERNYIAGDIHTMIMIAITAFMSCGLLIFYLERSWTFKILSIFFYVQKQKASVHRKKCFQRSVLVATVMLNTYLAATVTHSRWVISVNQRKCHHMWPGWWF